MLADLRKDTQQIFQAGIKAADPYLAVKKYLQFDEGQLVCRLDLNDKAIVRKKQWQKIYLVAFGKAACTMIKAAQEIIPAQFLAGKAIAVTNYANVQKIENIDVIGAGHPLPNQDGQAGAQKIVEQVMLAQQGDLVLVLVSGGGSALMPAPVSAISLEEKIMTTELLLGSGATINEINCVRKHLSILKGGGLAKMIAPADLHALILSDVLDDDLGTIASGPTEVDSSTFADALKVLNDKKLCDKVPAAVQDYLKKGSSGQVSETPKSDDPCFNQVTHTLIGSNAISLQAIRQASASLGYDVFIYSEQLAGEAQKVAEELALYAKNVIDKGIDKPCAILAGGETTVTIQGTGQGGRNQEMALAFVIAAEKYQLKAEWCFLSAGTDGRDGPTDAAGGLVDTNALERMHKAHIEAGLYLANNDSYHALQISEDLLMTGATGTNVADLQILLIQPNTKISQPGDQNV
ncbi:glycerate kinase [Methylococcaceae bacterium CS1]|nr:glycerate kinase [Methyloprofundus sp.]TXL01147.1 glycerate kinase [Methylococcaceae bacterium CS5]TXL07646.1 glycerate kinase [Methylococcaceae bacterium CS3]TXL07728.1 glycerate kinase [Methylococcaceae bacterium CS1]TXL10385.1 glycerate kinase [Methylococcaceae bacterium CS2]